jgi:hypothetical protein
MDEVEKALSTITTSEFITQIESIVATKKISYMDAVILFCEQSGIEIETAASIIKSCVKLKSKIQDDAEQLNFLPKTRKLIYE